MRKKITYCEELNRASCTFCKSSIRWSFLAAIFDSFS